MKVLENDELVGAWAGKELGVVFQRPFKAFGFTDEDGKLIAASILNNHYRGGNVEWTHVGIGSLMTNPEIMAFMTRFVFDVLKVSRVTCKTRRDNVVVRRLLPKGGFKFEAVLKRYFGPTKAEDAFLYGLYPENAKGWLNGRP